jgi:hypothetical protein
MIRILHIFLMAGLLALAPLSMGVGKGPATRPGLKQLPFGYRHAITTLDLPAAQQVRIAELYHEHQALYRDKQKKVTDRIAELQQRKKEALDEKDWKKLNTLSEAITRLRRINGEINQKRYVKLQRAIMGQLEADQKRDWPSLLLAGQALQPYARTLNDPQVQTVNKMCGDMRSRIAKIESLGELHRLRDEIRRRIWLDVMTAKQRQALQQGRAQPSGSKDRDTDKDSDHPPRRAGGW